jgi:hypothetical protein
VVQLFLIINWNKKERKIMICPKKEKLLLELHTLVRQIKRFKAEEAPTELLEELHITKEKLNQITKKLEESNPEKGLDETEIAISKI